jgi:hypothetical protein
VCGIEQTTASRVRTVAAEAPLTWQRMNTHLRIPGLGLAALLAASGVGAQQVDRLQQTVWVRLGAFRANIDSLVRVDYTGTPSLGIPAAGTTLDFEDHLGLPESKTVPDAMIGLRLGERWRVELEGYRLNRTATRQLLDRAVIIGGTTYDIAASLRSSLDTSVIRLSAGYSLLKTAQSEAGVALGVQKTHYRLAFTGIGSFNGAPSAEASIVEEDSGPLPTVGLYGTLGLWPAWSLSARADFLPVNSRKIKGSLENFQANLYYAIDRHWSAAAGYRVVDYKVAAKNNGALGVNLQYRFRGPQLMLEAGF